MRGKLTNNSILVDMKFVAAGQECLIKFTFCTGKFHAMRQSLIKSGKQHCDCIWKILFKCKIAEVNHKIAKEAKQRKG